MILVDSSVWIDFFRNTHTPQTDWLDRNLETEELAVGDLILAEVLRGFTTEKGFNAAHRVLAQLEQVNLCGQALAVEAARNYRRLRAKGVTVRGTVDVIIATRCIADGLRLLHRDSDFNGFEEHLGLRVVDCGASQ